MIEISLFIDGVPITLDSLWIDQKLTAKNVVMLFVLRRPTGQWLLVSNGSIELMFLSVFLL